MKVKPFFMEEDDKYYVKTPYSGTFIALMHGIKGEWDTEAKVWIVQASDGIKDCILNAMYDLFGYVLDTPDEKVRRLQGYIDSSYVSIIRDARKVFPDRNIDDNACADDIYQDLLDVKERDSAQESLKAHIEYLWKLEADLSKADAERLDMIFE